jgi:2-polyprenyl-3-methyl-5-hydroxy-6-metoxy-1,4-benzoquinol methylase
MDDQAHTTPTDAATSEIKPKVETWDNSWNTKDYKSREFETFRQAEKDRLRWPAVESVFPSFFPSAEGLKSIEIGAGMGLLSNLLYQQKCDVSLLDFSKAALEKSRESFGADADSLNYIYGDAMNLAPELHHQYDIVLSSGLIEHFRGESFQKIVDAHRLLLKDKGIIIIVVPNKWCPAYRCYKFLAERFGVFEVGEEYPMSWQEMRSLAEHYNAVKHEIVGGKFWPHRSDTYFFLTRAFQKLLSKITPYRYSEEKIWNYSPQPEQMIQWKQFFSYSLTLVAYVDDNSSRA